MSELNLEKAVDTARAKLKRVQRSDDKTKRFYLVVLSSLAMVIVIGLWFFYLNITLPEPIQEEVVVDEKVDSESIEGDSFFDVITRGAKNIYEDFKIQFGKIGEGLGEVREFSLPGGGAQFSPEEPLSPTPLP